MEFRLLKAEEIDVRVQSTKKTGKGVGCILLLYKDARVDMNILDETYGANNWQRTHEVINNNLFCNIDVWDSEKGCWVRKQDVGVESNTEKEKGQASDSFKRAGFNWGIGRELYSSPFIWVDLQEGEYFETKDSNWKPKYNLNANIKFSVKSINYTERVITSLEIQDNKNTVRYALGTKKPSGQPSGNKNENNSSTGSTGGKKDDKKAEYKCSVCDAEINQAVHAFSTNKFKKALCRDCQAKEGK